MRLLALAAAFTAAALTCASAEATTSSVEITDMWWNPSESGWGMNVVAQRDIGFATFFVYDQNQNPVWYTAQLSRQPGDIWSGPLYATKAPWFGGPFPPNSVTVRQAGTATFTLVDLNAATLSYSVDNTTVTKSVQRQTWMSEDYSGEYSGGFSIQLTDCNPSSYEGLQELGGLLSVTQTGTDFQLATVSADGSCSFIGTYSQTGRMGRVKGNYNCADDTEGAFDITELAPSWNGFNAYITGTNQYCKFTGFIGGILRAQ
ncbi:MAG TPA: hypothetical protein VMV45_09225 [Casimicrobiaceae bacterium]|nr:hypothetical protein [Casimicrobiaceae bacterium]